MTGKKKLRKIKLKAYTRGVRAAKDSSRAKGYCEAAADFMEGSASRWAAHLADVADRARSDGYGMGWDDALSAEADRSRNRGYMR